MKRREFIGGMAAAALSGGLSSTGYAANGKVRLAAIGCGQQAWNDLQSFRDDASDICEVVALCDTDLGSEPTLGALKQWPKVPRFRDFRKMFDAMEGGIDAVLVAIPDFSHFPAAMHAMKLGKHVYVEKPLAHTFQECALLMQAAAKYGVVTQMGNQGHSSEKYFQHREYIEKGIIQGVTHVNVHMNMARRWHKYGGNVFHYPIGEAIPKTLDYETWLATARYHEYSPEYMRGEWRCWYDFGNGALGDWGAHTMDCVHEFLLKGDLPTKVELLKCEGWNQFVYPCATTLRFTFPKNALHDAMTLSWYDGAQNWPELPKGFVFDRPDGIPQNSANVAQTGKILYPGKEVYCKDGTVWQSLSHKHPLHRVGDFDAKLPDFPREAESHYRNFIRAVRGEEKAHSPFSVAGPLSQLFTLGCIAQRVRRGFAFDPAKGAILGDDYANYFINGLPPRTGWESYYKV